MAEATVGSIKNGISPLQRIAMEARRENLIRNEWGKHTLEYTKEVVRAEYDIQKEFPLN